VTALPYAGVRSFRALATRTAAVRTVLALVLAALVLVAAFVARSPHSTQPPILPASAGGVVVLDLSASITSDTYSRIHQTLQQLVARGGRYGLVVFSNTAYEALPPGTPAAALQPLARYFALPATTAPGAQPTFPVNPWSASFTSGTSIASGLDLARTIELAHGRRHPAVVLISDLADDPNDIQRLTSVLTAYKAQGIALRVIALNPAAGDVEYFSRLIGNASSIIPAGLSAPGTTPLGTPATSFPTWLVVLALALAVLLGVNELRSARLSWGDRPEGAV
jgi:hypothetical protein